MKGKEIELKEIEGHIYLEFGFGDDELLLLEFDLVDKEGDANV